MTRKPAKARGFSLLELVLVLGLVSAILAAALSTLLEGDRVAILGRQESEMRRQLRDILTLMVKELRRAGLPPPNTYDGHFLRSSGRLNLVSRGILAESHAGKLVFTGDINTDNRVDYVEYTVSGEIPPLTLTRRAGPIGDAGSLPGAPAQTLSRSIESCRFLYFDASGVATSRAAEAASVRIDLTLRSRAPDLRSGHHRTLSQSVRVRPYNP
ncbi:MAG: prepilin-type N-terminal cleavage/methylation domain-containing protein [Acidobacteriota bacterium]|nr:prepilin-type N-terminal cleavage/methylation domain-containing protein [Acidobacteriota bacterium]